MTEAKLGDITAGLTKIEGRCKTLRDEDLLAGRDSGDEREMARLLAAVVVLRDDFSSMAAAEVPDAHAQRLMDLVHDFEETARCVADNVGRVLHNLAIHMTEIIVRVGVDRGAGGEYRFRSN